MNIIVRRTDDAWTIQTCEKTVVLPETQNLIAHLEGLGYSVTEDAKCLIVTGKEANLTDLVQDFYQDKAEVTPF
jgi:hypothetical protein